MRISLVRYPGYIVAMSADRPTIFALSSGRPPAAIAVVRISGPRAGEALKALTAKDPPAPRRARLTRTTGGTGDARSPVPPRC